MTGSHNRVLAHDAAKRAGHRRDGNGVARHLLVAESQVRALIGVLRADQPQDDRNIVRGLRAQLSRA